jgi:hypothetical protein
LSKILERWAQDIEESFSAVECETEQRCQSTFEIWKEREHTWRKLGNAELAAEAMRWKAGAANSLSKFKGEPG